MSISSKINGLTPKPAALRVVTDANFCSLYNLTQSYAAAAGGILNQFVGENEQGRSNLHDTAAVKIDPTQERGKGQVR
jgi:hypothetical protein